MFTEQQFKVINNAEKYQCFETAVMHFFFVILIESGIDYITAVIYLFRSVYSNIIVFGHKCHNSDLCFMSSEKARRKSAQLI